MLYRACVLIAAALPVAFSSGCAREPFPLVKVKGRITYDDGSVIPAQRLVLTFVPQAAAKDDAKQHPPSATAEVNVADGTFTAATSHTFGDGLVRGRHKVQVVALDAQQNPLPAVPPQYARPSETPLEVDTERLPFELKVAKPQS